MGAIPIDGRVSSQRRRIGAADGRRTGSRPMSRAQPSPRKEPMSIVPNLGSMLKRIDEMLVTVEATLDRVDRTTLRLNESAAHLDLIPELHCEVAELRTELQRITAQGR